jgi:predicted pyridoxine 5'-phosphate oxidase superfamily flavin-nucleotide-binding protein
VIDIPLGRLELCFEGAVPAVIATASADGVPNVTYLSRVRRVDDEHIALSNQFFSKTVRNLAENPRASLVLVDPTTYDEFRLDVVFERTERQGPVFDRLREDVDAVAAIHGMQDVFKLRAADIYRVVGIELVNAGAGAVRDRRAFARPAPVESLAELGARLGRAGDLDAVVGTTVSGLADLLGYEHCSLFLLDEDGTRLYTIASHGYPSEGVGSEIVVGEGLVGMAAARAAPIRLGNLRQVAKYAHAVRQVAEDAGVRPGREIPPPVLPNAQSRVAVPATALGRLVGVVMVESSLPVAFGETDEATLLVVASLVGNAIEVSRAHERAAEVSSTGARPVRAARDPSTPTTRVRFFAVDGSTFLDGDYLIKGVAGRILWSLLQQYDDEGRVDFTNKEVRLDPALELPQFRDNLDSRLILLKRRLDERRAPIRIDKTGRGRFRLVVETGLRLEETPAPA